MARHELGRALGELVQKNHQIEKSTLHKPYGTKRLRVSKCSSSKVDENPQNWTSSSKISQMKAKNVALKIKTLREVLHKLVN